MMKVTVLSAQRVASPVASRISLRRSTFARRVVTRAQSPEDLAQPSASVPAPVADSHPLQTVSSEVQGPTGNLAILGTTQEAINGRAAMLGFVAAVLSEAATHQGVWSQIAGRYIDGDLVEAPLGTATLLFGAVVGLTTMATLVPKLVDNLEVDSKSFGPFTPGLEKLVGRVAQLGFAGLLIVELVKGSALLG